MASHNKFANATVHCLNEKLGCSWKGLLKDLEEHSGTCDKELLRNAIISIHRLEARLDLKDRETLFLKNDFAIKVEAIAKQRKLKQRDEFDKFEKLAVILKDEIEKLRVEKTDENSALKEEIEKMKNEMSELKEQHKEEMKNLKEKCNLIREEEKTVLKKDLESQKITPLTTTVTNSPTSSLGQVIKAKANITSTYFDFAVGGEALGRVVIDLFTDKAPQNCTKFVELCAHKNGIGYRGSRVNELFTDRCALGHRYHLTYPSGVKELPSEYFKILENKSAKHDRARLVTMHNNSGKTESYFYIMSQPNVSFNRLNVVIGEVTEGTWGVVEEIRKNYGAVKITDCGVIN